MIIPIRKVLQILPLLAFLACNRERQIRSPFYSDIQLFGNDKTKFEEIYRSYSAEDDSLSIKSLTFVAHELAVQIKRGDLNAKHDVGNITREQIDQNIRISVEMCRDKLTNKQMSLPEYLNFVLPFNIENDLNYGWKNAIVSKFDSLKSLKLSGLISDDSLCNYFNTKLSEGFKYSSQPGFIPFKSWAELEAQKNGNCDFMTHAILYPLRAFGIPCAIDYNICWSNYDNNGHAWNVIVKGNDVKTLMGLESNLNTNYSPFKLVSNRDSAKSSRICGKIFRRTQYLNTEAVSYRLFRKNAFFQDVTDQYFKTADIQIPIKSLSSEYYICNYNQGKWQPVYFGINSNGFTTFNKMASSQVYNIVEIDESGQFHFISPPLYVSSDFKLVYLNADYSNSKNVEITSINGIIPTQIGIINKFNDWKNLNFLKMMDSLYEGKLSMGPVQGHIYKLYVWITDKWQLIETCRMKNHALVFKIPSSGLYFLEDKTNNKISRIFTILNRRQVWL